MKKFRLYFDKDKETEWINALAKEGYALTKFFAGLYTFEKCEPGEYIYQIDLGNKLFAVDEGYKEFMEENDIEIVQTWGMWIFLRKKADKGDFVLYTDVDSSIEHYTKIRNMFKVVTILELLCFMLEFVCYIQGVVFGLWGMLLIGALIIVLLNAVVKTNQTIAELKERKGDSYTKNPAKQSPVLIAGLLLNCVAMGIPESVNHYITLSVRIFAIVLMLIGIYQCRELFQKD